MSSEIHSPIHTFVPAGNEEDALLADLLKRVSRTFALSIMALPHGLRHSARTAYLLCRVVDTIEDEPQLESDRRNELFAAFDASLIGEPPGAARLIANAGLTDDGAGGDLMRHFDLVLREFRARPANTREVIRRSVLEMSKGMREYATRREVIGRPFIRDLGDLERYCYFVAGTVGKMLTQLFIETVPPSSAPPDPPLSDRGVSFGLGLQLVNIIKDLAPDFERGDCFVPRELLESAAVPVDGLLDPELRPKVLVAVAALTHTARKHLAKAVEYTLDWPVKEGYDVRLFCTVPLALAYATLERIETGEDTALAGREPKVDRETTLAILERAREAAKDDSQLREMLHAAAGLSRAG